MFVQLGFQANYQLVKEAVQLNSLPGNPELLGDSPSRQLMQDMARRGQITPIKVAITERGPFVIAGTRRIKAARELGWAAIDALLVEMPYEQALWERSAENNLRSNNDKADIDAIKEAVERGLNDREISAWTGASLGRIKKLRRFLALPGEIIQCMEEEIISTRTAEAIARMDPAFWPGVQAAIAQAVIEKKKFTTADVESLQRAGVAETYAQLEIPDFGIAHEAEPEFLGFVTLDKDGRVLDGLFTCLPTWEGLSPQAVAIGEVYLRRERCGS